MKDTIDPAVADLGGRWHLSDAGGEYQCDMTIPGDGITALHDAGLIPDPYWGRNEYDLRWIADRDWTLSRTFHLDDDTSVDLLLSGLDTVATVSVNGNVVLTAQNAFRDYRVDLSGAAVPGENEIVITFHSSTAAANRIQEGQPFYIPYHAGNSPIPNGNMLRKVQCDFGWDWNIALAPFGLNGKADLLRQDAPRIDRVSIAQEHEPGKVSVSVTLHTSAPSGTKFMVTFAGEEVGGVTEGDEVTVWFDIENPDLWWPAGLGAQHLHDLKVDLDGVIEHRRIGLRKMELVTEKDDAGLGFKFRVNGKDVFARGANWIPADALSGRITDAKTRDLLQSAVDANMNMIRVWGGGRYEPTSFYDACDELGLMVWQDFMFSCNLYPSTPEFLAEVVAEVRDNVARMHHHACLAVWCGDNELIGALTWFPESRDNRDRYLVNYDRLNRAIETTLLEVDPTAIWWPSSPSPGPMNFGDAWHDDGSGDMHFWSVWHEGRDFDHYRDVSPRFCSEFGFQSYPSMEAIRRFAGPGDLNIAAPVLESHQKNKGGNARIAETMFRYFRWPERFEDFVYLSQVQQGLAIKTAVTHWRSLKPHCMGTLYWQLNDTWPVCSWASLDHGGGWKLLHHMAKQFFAPVVVTAVPGQEGIALRAVNDNLDPVTLEVDCYAVTDTGGIRSLGTHNAKVGPDAAVVVTIIPEGTLATDEFLSFTWREEGKPVSGDIFAPKLWKAYNITPANLTHAVTEENGVWQVTVSTDTLGLFVTLEADLPGRFSQNAFTLFNGYPATVTFTPTEPGPEPRFTLRDLHSATTARHS